MANQVAGGASWVSFHHGGGVGIGNSLHAGIGDRRRRGRTPPPRRLERVLHHRPTWEWESFAMRMRATRRRSTWRRKKPSMFRIERDVRAMALRDAAGWRRFVVLAAAMLGLTACRALRSRAEKSAAPASSSDVDRAEASSRCAFSRPGTLPLTCDGEMRALGDRPYCLEAPTPKEGERLPLVISLHGYGSSGEQQARYFGFDMLAREKRFVLAKPNGTTNRAGQRYWNASSACCASNRDTNPPDDVAYIDALIDDVASHEPIDDKRVYIVGHSNGAFMAHRLACDRSNRVAAIRRARGRRPIRSSTANRASPFPFSSCTAIRIVSFDTTAAKRSPASSPTVELSVSLIRMSGRRERFRFGPSAMAARSLRTRRERGASSAARATTTKRRSKPTATAVSEARSSFGG